MSEDCLSPTPEFSFVIELSETGQSEKTYPLKANEEERRRVAARLGALSLDMFEGEVRIRVAKPALFVGGSVRAHMVRECVSSLESVREEVVDDFELEFSRERPAQNDTEQAGDEDWTEREAHSGEALDIGELLVQQLSLAMEAFPRHPDAPSLVEKYGQDGEASPFAMLHALSRKTDKNQ